MSHAEKEPRSYLPTRLVLTLALFLSACVPTLATNSEQLIRACIDMNGDYRCDDATDEPLVGLPIQVNNSPDPLYTDEFGKLPPLNKADSWKVVFGNVPKGYIFNGFSTDGNTTNLLFSEKGAIGKAII
ncbi:MAG: hypothetical protein WCG44_02635 [bacterium]